MLVQDTLTPHHTHMRHHEEMHYRHDVELTLPHADATLGLDITAASQQVSRV